MDSPNREVKIFAGTGELYRQAAGEFTRLSEEAVKRRGRFTVALSGGKTPAGLYELLSDVADTFRGRVPWEKIHVFFGDERHVGPHHPESNYRMARTALLSKVPVRKNNVHRIEAEQSDPRAAAEKYEEMLKAFFNVKPGGMPSFDLILLGMGADGHTASLFPGTEVIFERERLVAAPWVEKLSTHRITLTPPVIQSASCVIFLVAGKEKAETLRSVLEGNYRPERFPAQLACTGPGRVLFFADHPAASLLDMAGSREKTEGAR